MGVYLSMHVEAWDQHRLLSFPLCLRQVLSPWTWRSWFQLDWLAREPLLAPLSACLYLPPFPGITGVYHHVLILHGCWDLNLGPHACSKRFIYRTISPTHKSTLLTMKAGWEGVSFRTIYERRVVHFFLSQSVHRICFEEHRRCSWHWVS